MKRISIIMMALALVMGMSQCKKDEQTASNNNGEKPILTVSIGNDSKLWLGPQQNGLIPVYWNNNDYVYVAVNGKCLGYLVSEGVTFPGNWANFTGYPSTFNPEGLQAGDLMELYVLGGVEQNIIPVTNGTDYATISYANQSAKPTVISHGVVDKVYNPNDPEEHYHCDTLVNMNALVKFSVEGANTDVPITICGVKTQSVVSFDGTIVNSDEEGNIVTFRGVNTYGGQNNTRYAVVPSNQRATSGNIIATGFTGTYEIYEGAYGTNSVMRGKITLTPAK